MHGPGMRVFVEVFLGSREGKGSKPPSCPDVELRLRAQIRACPSPVRVGYLPVRLPSVSRDFLKKKSMEEELWGSRPPGGYRFVYKSPSPQISPHGGRDGRSTLPGKVDFARSVWSDHGVRGRQGAAEDVTGVGLNASIPPWGRAALDANMPPGWGQGLDFSGERRGRPL